MTSRLPLEDVLRALRVSHSAGETLGNPYVRLDADLVAEVISLLTPASENRAYIPPPADANGKRPRLFYWEDAEDCWCPAEGLEVDNIISVDRFVRDGDIEEIRFKREDMTDAEFAAIPEG